jgi:acetoin utilization deacetylase AcuC-like enzyme
MKLFYSKSYTLASYVFDTTRKAGWIAESLRLQSIDGVELTEPVPASEEQLLLAHDANYVQAVKSGSPLWLAESQGFDWDPQLWHMVCASTGGVIEAARAAAQEGIAGSLSTGLHHARREAGAGFCTFNGLALAALDALARGAHSILILDLDAHCGGGTHSLLGHDPRIHLADIAVSSFDYYRPVGHNRFQLLQDASAYLPAVQSLLTDLEREGDFDLCLYNAGMDPYEGCSIGGLPGITETLLHQRELLVFPWLRSHARAVAFVLAGGYVSKGLSQDALVALHRLTIECAAANSLSSTDG